MSNIDAYKSEATLNSVNNVLLCDGFLIHFFFYPFQMPEQANRSSPHRPLSPSHFTSPYKVKLRAKTPSQFPSELANLDTALCQGDSRLESIRRGRGLFELMEKHEALKVSQFCVSRYSQLR